MKLPHSISKVTAPVKNTLTAAVQKPSLKTVGAAMLLATPVGLVGTIAVGNSPALKNTLAAVSAEVKKDANVVSTKAVSTVKKAETVVVAGAKKASSVAGGIMDKLMMPLMIVGGLGLAMMFLRK